MNMRMIAAMLAAGASFITSVAPGAAPAAPQEQRIELGSRGAIVVQVPANWQYSVGPPDDSVPPTVRFTPTGRQLFEVLLTLFAPPPDAPADFGTPQSLRRMVEKSSGAMQAVAAGEKISIKPLGGKQAGYYFSVTGKAPKPGEYPYMTQGATRIGNFLATFSVFTRDLRKSVVTDTLKLLRGAKQLTDTAVPIYYAHDSVHLRVPGHNWELTFPSADWTLTGTRKRENESGYYVRFEHRSTGLDVSYYLEPASQCASSEACRELFWKNPGPGYEGAADIERFEQNGFSVLKCVVPVKAGDKPVKQLNYSAHLVRDGYWIDMHLSQTTDEGRGDPLLKKFVDSVALPGAPVPAAH